MAATAGRGEPAQLRGAMKRNLRSYLQLRMLRAITTIDEQQSLLKASGALGITQPALTRTLREVERILGGQIFERHSRGVSLTSFGSVAANAARRILTEVDRLDAELDHYEAGKTNVVSIGAMAPAAVGVLPGYFAHLRDEAPDMHIAVRQGTMEELMVMLENGEISLLIGRLYPTDRFDQEEIYFERVSILARAQHPIFTVGEISNQTLSQFPFVLPAMSHQVEDEFEHLLTENGFKLEVKSAPLTFVRELLHTSDCLTISPLQSMGGDIARGSIGVVPIDLPGPPRPAGIMLSRDRGLNKHEQAVLALLREYLLESQAPSLPQ